MKLLFATTCQNREYIEQLYKSILDGNKTLDLCVISLLQKGVKVEEKLYKNDFSKFIFLYTDNGYGLSKARNIIINYITKNNIKFDYIMFPDDDSTFDASFFENFEKIVTGNSLISVYNQNTKVPYKMNYESFTYADKNQFEMAMSVNMIVSYDTFIKVGTFDENMGVGAKYGAGEDGDYFIRCCNESGQGFNVAHEIYNYHPANNQKFKLIPLRTLVRRYRTYGEGVIYLCVKHKMYGKALKCVASGIFGALYAFICFNLKLSLARICGTYYRTRMLMKLMCKTHKYF